MHLFGLITTARSADYTATAIRSLLAHTPRPETAGIVLIDNDGVYTLPPDIPSAAVTVDRPAAPRSFAANANVLLAYAREAGADLVLLNNDLVFTPGWFEPFMSERRTLLAPMSNADVPHRTARLHLQPVMALDDYLGREADLEIIAERHRATHAGYRTVPAVPYFCIRIPRAVHDIVGDFDERFGPGGGEDRDYTVRAWIAGIPQQVACASLVLHFQGRSTWRGGEATEAREAREAAYLGAFEHKWGAALTHAFIHGHWNLLRHDARYAGLLARQDYAALVRALRSRPAVDTLIARQRASRFGAVICLYEDDTWLEAAVESAYDACERVWLLVGDAPWNGDPTDQSALLARVASLADPQGKCRLVRGHWPDEAAQRNAGLALVAEAGLDYCLVLDADEVYEPAQLARAMAIARENPQVDCWRVPCLTYWKSHRYRIDPPEQVAAAMFVRVGSGRFVENRVFDAGRHMPFPADIVVCHHMSYARTDEQVLRKVTTFGHARDVVPGWFDNVWRRWDHDPTLENLNPCWPAAYRRAIEQPSAALPTPLQRRLPALAGV